MKLRATYNLLVLLLIYSFSCFCVRGIEAVYGASLNMAVVFDNVWTATIETVFLSIIVTACIWFNRSINDSIVSSALNTATPFFNTMWFAGLAFVVMCNLSGFGEILTDRVKTIPFLLGVAVNVIAILLYCLSFFTVEKYGTGVLYKTVVSVFATIFSLVSITFSTSYMPISIIQAIYKDGERHDLLKTLESEIESNPDFKTDLSSWSKNYVSDETRRALKDAIQTKDISISEIDNSHIKMTWKRNVNPEELDSLTAKNEVLKCYKKWHDWGCFFKQNEKIVEMTAKAKKTKHLSESKPSN